MKLHISFPPFQTKDIINLRDSATPYQLKKWVKKRYGRIITNVVWKCTIITSDDLNLKQFKDIGIKELDYIYLIPLPHTYEQVANQLLEMGFNIKDIIPALEQTSGSLERTLCSLVS